MLFLFQGEKYLVLKRKFRQPTLDLSSPTISYSGFSTNSPISTPDTSTPTSPFREPPPYRPPPIAPLSPISNTSSPIRRYSHEPTIGIPILEPPIGIPISEPPIGLPIADPYIGIPVVEENASVCSSRSMESIGAASSPVTTPPAVPPRKKSQDKIKVFNKENQDVGKGKNGSEAIKVCKLY